MEASFIELLFFLLSSLTSTQSLLNLSPGKNEIDFRIGSILDHLSRYHFPQYFLYLLFWGFFFLTWESGRVALFWFALVCLLVCVRVFFQISLWAVFVKGRVNYMGGKESMRQCLHDYTDISVERAIFPCFNMTST